MLPAQYVELEDAMPMAPYTRIEEGEEIAGVVTPVAPRRSLKWGVLAAVAGGVATVGYVATRNAASTPGAAEVAASFKSLDSDTMKLSVTNEDYATPPASLGSGLYEWSYNVEPERNNYLEVSLVDDT